jgi:hypothetical protein
VPEAVGAPCIEMVKVVVTTFTDSGKRSEAVTVVAAVSYEAVQIAPTITVAVCVHTSVESVQVSWPLFCVTPAGMAKLLTLRMQGSGAGVAG